MLSDGDCSFLRLLLAIALTAVAAAAGLEAWPPGSSLRIGHEEPAFTLARVQAGRSYGTVAIDLPRPLCAELETSGADPLRFFPVAHVHDQVELDVILQVQADAHVHLFVGPTLDDGYEVLLDAPSPASTILRGDEELDRYSHGPVLGGFASPARSFWVSLAFGGGQARVGVGSGGVLGQTPFLSAADSNPPLALVEGATLWVATSNGQSAVWEACLAGDAAPTFNTAEHTAPLLKLVNEYAAFWDCRSTIYNAPTADAEGFSFSASASQDSAWPLPLTVSETRLSWSGDPFMFVHGGFYSLCYKPDANDTCMCSAGLCSCSASQASCSLTSRVFGTCEPFAPTPQHNSMLFVQLQVIGVWSDCREDGCLGRERWNCYMGAFHGSKEGPCRIDLSPNGRYGWGMEVGTVSRMVWTPTWGEDIITSGALQQTSPRFCGDPGTPSTNFDEPPVGPDGHFGLELWPADYGIVEIPDVKQEILRPFTVTLCYCPDYSASGHSSSPCKAQEDYIQGFGVLLFWMLRICDYPTYEDCIEPYARVAPQKKFVLRVDCPSGGVCSAGLNNRIKVLDATQEAQEQPSWSEAHDCRKAKQETANAIWPLEGDSLNLPGGLRMDYKAWAQKQLLLDVTAQQRFTVCYCDRDCTFDINWFQVGEVSTVLAFAFATNTGSPSPLQTVKYVNSPGSFTLLGGISSPRPAALPSPYDTNMYSGQAMLKMISFDHEVVVGGKTLEQKYDFAAKGHTELQIFMDTECRALDFSPTPVGGLDDVPTAFARVAEASYDLRHLAFAGGEGDQLLTPNLAGTLVVCYCGRVTGAGNCLSDDHWIFAGLMQIRGPRGGQQWSFPTKTLVRVNGIEGWGFEPTDKLRILDSQESCLKTLEGSTLYKVGCPTGSSTAPSCRQASSVEEIAVSMLSATNTGIDILSIEIEGARSSVLIFSGDISTHFEEGDEISIDPQHITVAGRVLDSMEATERFNALLLSGRAEFQDSPGEFYLSRRHRVHHVTEPQGQDSSDVVLRSKRLRIGTGWSADDLGGIPDFGFLPSAAGSPQWVRRSRLDTEVELKVSTNQPQMPICWSALEGGVQRFFAGAGYLTFASPPMMAMAKLRLTARQSGAMAPVVLAFAIQRSQLDYARSLGEMTLTMRFVNATSLKLSSFSSQVSAVELPLDGEVPAEDMSQALCGFLFAELWANDPRGFPVPKGCYYGPMGGTGEPWEREFVMVFDRYSGLRNLCQGSQGFCEYQMVFRANATGLVDGKPLMDLDTGCRYQSGGCKSEFELYERGVVTMSGDSLPEAQPGQMRIHGAGGFQIQGLDEHGVAAFDATGDASVQIFARADEASAFERSAILRIFLSPLTAWHVGLAPCIATCVAAAADGCVGPVECITEAAVPGIIEARRNVLKLRLPETMGRSVNVTLKVSDMPAPSFAFFPTVLSAELADAGDAAPHYVVSQGYLAWLGSGSPQMDARLLVTGPSGDGDHPFQDDINSLYIRLVVSATIQTTAFGVASLRVALPVDYTCYVHGSGRVAHPYDGGDEARAQYSLLGPGAYDNEPGTVFILDLDQDDHADFPRGTMRTAASDGTWEESSRHMCVYTLEPGQALQAGQVVFVEFQVKNPGMPLPQAAAANQWTVQLHSPGMSDQGVLFETPMNPFVRTEQASALNANGQQIWASNVGVLGPLGNTLLQPSDFGVGATHFLHIYFQPFQEIGAGGEVLVDAPSQYAFGDPCVAEDLNEASYAVRSGPGLLQPLPGIEGCAGASSPGGGGPGTKRAHVQVSGRLVAGRMYGFRLLVTNPLESGTTDARTSWRMWTADSGSLRVDGTPSGVGFLHEGALSASMGAASWTTYPQSWPAAPTLSVEGGAMRPYNVFKASDTLTLGNVHVPGSPGEEVHTSLRVIAPPGVRFRGALIGDSSELLGVGEALLPSEPVMPAESVMEWPTLSLQVGVSYTFQVFIDTVDTSVHAAAHAFFLELGYNSEGRIGAAVFPAPPVRMVSRAYSEYLSSRTSFHKNVVVFHFRLATDVMPGIDAGLLISGGENMQGGRLLCSPTSAVDVAAAVVEQGGEGIMPLSIGFSCDSGSDGSGAPFLLLRPQQAPLQKGIYAVEVQVSNPGSDAGTSLLLSVSTVFNASDELGTSPIDAPAAFEGFTLRSQMASAELAAVDGATPRDDRPGRMNTVLLSFRPSLWTPSELNSTLSIRAPYGFVFQENCLPAVLVDLPSIFGDAWVTVTDTDFAPWGSATPLSCQGLRNVASLLVPPGLMSGAAYLLQIGVTNPHHPPSRNFWSIELDLEASEPFAGFPLARVEFLLPPKAVDVALGSTEVAPVTLLFMLQQHVPFGGLLLVTAPPGFSLHNASSLRPASSVGDEELQALLQLDRSISVIVSREDGITALKPYVIQVLATNPSTLDDVGEWALATFNTSGSPLDEGVAPGYGLLQAAFLDVTNLEGQMYSGKAVSVQIHAASPLPILFGDTLLLEAPLGFPLQGAGSSCNGFAWLSWTSAAPKPFPVCSCAFGPCTLLATFESTGWEMESELQGVAYAAALTLEFFVSSENPSRNPPLEQAYWRISHMRQAATEEEEEQVDDGGASSSSSSSSVEEAPGTEALAVASRRTWVIRPQLEDVAVTLVGNSQAAGAESAIQLQFTPMSAADAIRLEAEYPREVGFDDASVDAPKQLGSQTGGAVLVIRNMGLAAGVHTSVIVSAVRLGRGGGQSVFSLATFVDETLVYQVDERLHFDGFYQSGRVSLDTSLAGPYATEPETYPVQSAFAPRGGEESRATFVLSVSFPVHRGDHLVLSCEGAGAYTLVADERFRASRLAADFASGEELEVSIEPHGLHSLDITLLGIVGEADPSGYLLDSGRSAEIVVWVVPTLGINNWRAETYSGSTLTNTNDGDSAGFAPVAQLSLLIQSPVAPPGTIVEVKFQATLSHHDPDDPSSEGGGDTEDVAPEVFLVAPEGFSFPELCGDICSSRGDTFGSTAQATATLTSPTSATLLGVEMRFLVSTPRRTPSNLIWVAEARGLAGQVVGWGSIEGFKVNQMDNAAVYHGGVLGMVGAQLVFTFTLTEDPGDTILTTIDVTAPEQFMLSCEGDDLHRISLPGGPPVCENDGLGFARLVLNESLRVNDYAFAVSADFPAIAPASNVFAIVIRERGTEVIADAAFDIPGWPMAPALQTRQPTLAWTTAGYEGQSTVTVGITFSNSTSQILAFLITLPSGFEHRVRETADVKVSNVRLPLLRGGQDWLDATSPDRLRLLFELSDPEIDEGSYLVSFPVQMPESPSVVSALNFWRFSLCVDRSCLLPEGSDVLTSFPNAGFMPGEVSALEAQRASSRAARTGPAVAAARRSAAPTSAFWLLGAAAAAATRLLLMMPSGRMPVR